MNELHSLTDFDQGYQITTMEQIAAIDQSKNQVFDSIKDFVSFAQVHPNDPYIANIYALIARAYVFAKQEKLAQFYFEKVINAPIDVSSNGQSVKKEATSFLMSRISDPELSVFLRESYIAHSKQGDSIDKIYYDLGFLYETIGEFEKSRNAFNSFLSLQKPGMSNAEITDVKERLALYDQPRDWSRRSLDQLISEIKFAINEKDIGLLYNIRTKSGFFSMSWLQERDDFNSIINFDLDRFVLASPTIHFADTIEDYSNSQEAYLKSWGWSNHIPVWYLYFRKADFPADPDYNGTWEWIGVYFGDAIQDNSPAL